MWPSKIPTGFSGNFEGHVALRTSDYDRARRFYIDTLGFSVAMEVPNLFIFFAGSTTIAVRGPEASRGARAARVFGAAAALREAIGSPLPPRCRASYQHTITTLRTQLGEEAFATAWDEGQTMTLAQAVAFTLKENDTI